MSVLGPQPLGLLRFSCKGGQEREQLLSGRGGVHFPLWSLSCLRAYSPPSLHILPYSRLQMAFGSVLLPRTLLRHL